MFVHCEERLMGYRQSQLVCSSWSSVRKNVTESDNGEHRSLAASIASALALNPLFPNRKTDVKCGSTLERIHQWELAGPAVTRHMGLIGLNELFSCSVHLVF